MTTPIVVTLTPDELDARMLAMFRQALALTTDAIATRSTDVVQPRKHAYTIAEVAEQIGYRPSTVLTFIKAGRKAKNGKTFRLPAREITTKEYRVLPADLDKWLLNF